MPARRLSFAAADGVPGFRAQLAEQRWDDHRLYHHSLVNQSLHFVSACTFLTAYALVFRDPAIASLLAWGVAMTSRQAGHFFFEPRDYDAAARLSHGQKEDVKIGYNLFRKWVLMSLWAAVPIVLAAAPTLFGLLEPAHGAMGFLRRVGIGWLMLGVGGIAFRSVQLFVQQDVETGVVWAAKIVTDPFSDFWLYRSAPLRLLKGERIDDRHAA